MLSVQQLGNESTSRVTNARKRARALTDGRTDGWTDALSAFHAFLKRTNAGADMCSCETERNVRSGAGGWGVGRTEVDLELLDNHTGDLDPRDGRDETRRDSRC